MSACNYWLARSLAERGHEVNVVTNAHEVEADYRMHLGPGDDTLYEPVFPASGGRVRVFPTEPAGPRTSHIPEHNPFATKLAGLATQVVREHGCELIYAYYYEPYGIAAQLVSTWTRVPWIVRHAGSDLDRLMRVPELGAAHKEALLAANAVICGRGLADRFSGMGVSRDRLFSHRPWVPPPAFFNPDASPLSVDDLPATLFPTDGDGARVPFDPSLPTIGIYGKVGSAKGSFDLLRALAILRREGRQFNFLAMTQGQVAGVFARVVGELGLNDRTWMLPFLPNWRVPSFIRRCTAVCFLERDFPIKIHTPIVAREVLSVGSCLVVSDEIARKQPDPSAMVDGENVFVVEDPKVHTDLAAKLRAVIEDPERAKEIGAAGTSLAGDPEDFGDFVDSWEQILLRVAGCESTAESYTEMSTVSDAAAGDAAHDARIGKPRGFEQRMPWLAAVLPGKETELLERFRATAEISPEAEPLAAVEAFTRFLSAKISSNGFVADKKLIEDCLRFQTHRSRAQRDDDATRGRLPFAAADLLAGRSTASPEARELRPLRSRHAEVVEFDHDVTPLFTGAEPGDRSAAKESRTIVCFLRTPNLLRTELKLSAGVQDLLELCDGSRTTQTILDTVAARRAVEESARPEYEEQILAALQQLYDQRVLVFCRQPRT